MKRIIEIDDNLDEIVDSTIDRVKDELLFFLDLFFPEQNPDRTEISCILNDPDYSGTIEEIIDVAVPLYYTKQINDLWYLYGDEFEKAFDNAGIGDKNDKGWKPAAIYCYIEQKVHEWYHDHADEIFREWKAARE